MARKIYYYKRIRSHVRSQTAANRDPRRKLRLNDSTGPNLLPNVGVFARAGPSGAPKPKKSAKPKKKNRPAQDGDAEPSESRSVGDGVSARAGPSSGAPQPKKSVKHKKKNRPPVESRSPSPSLLEPSNNLEGEDVGGDVGEDGSAAANELEQSNEVQSSSPESKKPKICLYVKFKKAANSGEAPGKF